LDVGLEPDCGQRRGSAGPAQGQGHPGRGSPGAAACTPIAPRARRIDDGGADARARSHRRAGRL